MKKIKVNRKTLFLAIVYAAILVVGAYGLIRFMVYQDNLKRMDNIVFQQYEGPADAPKTIVEFLDYRCSYCRDMHPILMDLIRRNPDVKIVYRHYPLIAAKQSLIEAEIALAAGMHGHDKFKEAHEFLINHEEPVSEREIDEIAIRLGIDVDIFRQDMKNQDMGYFLIETINIGKAIGVSSTPTFMIGNIKYELTNGMPTVETFENLLEQAYGK